MLICLSVLFLKEISKNKFEKSLTASGTEAAAATTIIMTTTHHILAICTSCEKTSYGATTGIWLDELATPYYIWQEAGYDVTICSIAGNSPSIDPGSMNEEGASEGSTRRFLTDPDAQHKFTNAPSLAQIIAAGKMKSYSCVYLVGGHGCLEDFPDNVDIKEAVEYFYAEVGGCLASICHGPLGCHCGRSEND